MIQMLWWKSCWESMSSFFIITLIKPRSTTEIRM
jgi:hypothetical protein